MFQPRCLRAFVVFLLALVLLAGIAAAAPQTIGSLGAKFEASGWERVSINKDVGKDQFQRQGETEGYLMAFEIYALFDQREAFLAQLEGSIGNIAGRFQNLRRDPEVLFERSDAFSRATTRLTGQLNGLELGYQIDLISAGDGVGYLLLSWSNVSDFSFHQAAMEEWIDSFRLPGEGTDWYAKSRPTAHTIEVKGWQVELTYPETVFTLAAANPKTPSLRTLAVPDENTAVHLLVEEVEGDADQALDAIYQVLADGESYQELMREDASSAAGNGRQMLIRGGEPALDIRTAVFALKKGVWLEMRLASNINRDVLWKGLLASLVFSPEVELDAYPQAVAVESEPAFPTEAARRLLEGSDLLTRLSWSRDVAIAADGRLYFLEGRKLMRVAPAAPGADPGEAEVYFDGSDPAIGDLDAFALWSEQVVFWASGQEVRRLVAGKLEAAGFRADLATLAGADLLIARSAPLQTLFGYGDLPAVGASQLLLRRPAGTERVVAELPERKVEALASRDGLALVASLPRGETEDHGESRVELEEIELATGARRPRGNFVAVTRLAPAPGGWLVSGTSAVGEEGVFLLADDGVPELLLRGDQRAFGLTAGELTFAAAPCLHSARYSTCLYRASLELVRREGPQFQGLGARQLHTIAVAAKKRTGLQNALAAFPATRGGADALLAAADQAARELVGRPLPTEVREVDELFDRLATDRELTDDGALLLAVVVAEAFLRQGASWVAPLGVAPGRGSSGWEIDNAEAVGLVPADFQRGAFGEDGWYQPVATVLERAEGRQLFVGPDPTALREAVKLAAGQTLPGLVRGGKAEALIAYLGERRANAHLRGEVYRQLAALGRNEVLAKVSSAFAGGGEARTADLVALAAAQLAGSLAAPAAEALVAQLRGGISREPANGLLYLLLGKAYEATARADRLAYARAAYEKAASLVSWGYVGHTAAAALERLQVKP